MYTSLLYVCLKFVFMIVWYICGYPLCVCVCTCVWRVCLCIYGFLCVRVSGECVYVCMDFYVDVCMKCLFLWLYDFYTHLLLHSCLNLCVCVSVFNIVPCVYVCVRL